MLKIENTVLLLVDVQGKLARLMYEKERLFDNLQRIKDAGAAWTSVETALFELLGVAEGETFKAMLKIVK